MHISPQLTSLIEQHGARPVAPAVQALARHLLARYGDSAVAVLVYGSCFRAGSDDGLVDLYVLLGSYTRLPGNFVQRWLHHVLPPTVFYLEIPFEGRAVRAKCAVLSLADFERGTSGRWFHSYLWARFAQPTGVLYAQDEQVARRVHRALAQAIITFTGCVLPVLPPMFDARQLWQQGLGLSYATELRPERSDAVARLVDSAPEYYDQVTRVVMETVPLGVRVVGSGDSPRYQAAISRRARFLNRMAWAVRTVQGKTFNVCRLLKALFTFEGGVAYILWKIERHSGIKTEVPPHLQRHPWLALGVMLWKLYRRGAFH